MATEPRAMTAAERWYREKFAQTPERDALFTTISGERLEPLYTHEDLPDAERIGFPGEFPYTRGVYPSMYRGRLWTMRQFAGFGTAEETNERFRYLLHHGQTGLSTAFDIASLMGHDSDHPRSISGYHIREAGSTAQQELAFTLKDGFTYIEWALERGLDIDDFAPRLSFFFNAHIDFFEEIAKYRAARRIWAHELKHTYGAKNERSLLMRFHTQTAGVSLTAQQPLNNIIRTTVEALAGVLGGTQSLHTNSYDEALALPTQDAVRIALRTQQIIAHETGVTNTIDPVGGAYFVEALTDRMEEAAYAYFRRIDELGGMVQAIKQNFPQREIADASFQYQQEVDDNKRIVVGVNRYQVLDDAPIEILRIDPKLERKQVDRVKAVRGARDSEAAEAALTALKQAASG